jgi:hypothetical protein
MPNKKNHSIADELRDFSVADWMNWLDNILLYDVAPPINFINQDSDVIFDMMTFLFNSDIDTINYEEALLRNIDIYKDRSNSECNKFLERLIDGLQIIKMQSSYDLLINILKTEKYCLRKGTDDWGTKVLQILSFHGTLTKEQKYLIKESGFNHLSNIQKNNPAFLQNFISFIRQYYGTIEAYDVLRFCMQCRKDDPEPLFKDLKAVFEDKILEFNYFSSIEFNSSTFSWIKKNHLILKDNQYYSHTLFLISKIVNHPNFLTKIESFYEESEERKAGINLYLFINLLHKNSSIGDKVDIVSWNNLYEDLDDTKLKSEIFRETKSENFFMAEIILSMISSKIEISHTIGDSTVKTLIYNYFNTAFSVVNKWLQVNTDFREMAEKTDGLKMGDNLLRMLKETHSS